MTRTTLAALAAALTILPLGLVACGGNDDEATAASGDRAATTTGMESHASPAAAPSIESPAADLRVTLDRLLGEHALLATFAMQKGLDGSEDFEAITTALDGNTVDLGKAIGSVYGADAEQAFLKMWRDHIGFFVDYTVATAKKDEGAQEAARTKLADYQTDFSDFLATATDGKLPQNGAASALQGHVNQLVQAIETYAAGDYPAAYDQIREAYHHMFMTGDALSGAIVAQSPEKFTP